MVKTLHMIRLCSATRGRGTHTIQHNFFSRERLMSNNRVVHFEIPANEPKVLTNFYRELFGWKFQLAPIPGVEYWSCETGADGPGIKGTIMKRQNSRQPLDELRGCSEHRRCS